MIPTRHKSKLPKTLTWPLGAEAISAGLVDVPHVTNFLLWFADSPVWPKSAFQRLLREHLAYAIFVAEYKPAYKIAGASHVASWEMRVNPVLRPLRAVAGGVLRSEGLPAVFGWLRSFERSGWETRFHRLELVFSPADATLSQQYFNGV